MAPSRQHPHPHRRSTRATTPRDGARPTFLAAFSAEVSGMTPVAR